MLCCLANLHLSHSASDALLCVLPLRTAHPWGQLPSSSPANGDFEYLIHSRRKTKEIAL